MTENELNKCRRLAYNRLYAAAYGAEAKLFVLVSKWPFRLVQRDKVRTELEALESCIKDCGLEEDYATWKNTPRAGKIYRAAKKKAIEEIRRNG